MGKETIRLISALAAASALTGIIFAVFSLLAVNYFTDFTSYLPHRDRATAYVGTAIGITSERVTNRRLGWDEIFDSPGEAERYLRILKGKLTFQDTSIDVQYCDPYVYGDEAYPMYWSMEAKIPDAVSDELLEEIFDVLRSLGAYDDIRGTSEYWRDAQIRTGGETNEAGDCSFTVANY